MQLGYGEIRRCLEPAEDPPDCDKRGAASTEHDKGVSAAPSIRRLGVAGAVSAPCMWASGISRRSRRYGVPWGGFGGNNPSRKLPEAFRALRRVSKIVVGMEVR